jgi:hypothetical protein
MSAPEDREQGNKDKNGDKKTLKVTVFAPRDPDKPKRFKWDKHLTVGDAAAEAAAAFEYGPGTYSLSKDDEVLDRDKQLHAAHVRDGDELWLVDAGGGVGRWDGQS